MVKAKTIVASIFIGLMSVVLVACGHGNSAKTDNKTLSLSATSQLDTIDISRSDGYGQTGNVFESFYRLGKNGKVTPGIAKSATVSKDGKIWTFKLREAKWSNGDPITAQDFVYSWRRSLTPKTESPYSYLFSGVKNADQIIAGKMPQKLLESLLLEKIRW